ncbi:MAG TPA: NAD-dependent epimerase/dehydratase family protein, partial [Bacteroidales bacterium]|nr:NAD-dependent epimerase/dehydratase family protein [Bacteroidales bacterium]
MTTLKNVWILGGTGYIGRALVSVLSEMPGIRLNLLIHTQTPFKYLEHANVFTGSLQSFDLNWLKRYPPSVIFHMARLAGSSLVMRYFRSTTGARSNRRLLNFLHTENLKPVIVYVSGSLM